MPGILIDDERTPLFLDAKRTVNIRCIASSIHSDEESRPCKVPPTDPSPENSSNIAGVISILLLGK